MNEVMARFFAAVKGADMKVARSLLTDDPSLARAYDDEGATALHYAAFNGNKDMISLLLATGADVNARDKLHDATPAGWAIHYLRERGALLAIEIEDLKYAIERGDASWIERFVARHPALATAVDKDGTPVAVLAAGTERPEITRMFDRRGTEA